MATSQESHASIEISKGLYARLAMFYNPAIPCSGGRDFRWQITVHLSYLLMEVRVFIDENEDNNMAEGVNDKLQQFERTLAPLTRLQKLPGLIQQMIGVTEKLTHVRKVWEEFKVRTPTRVPHDQSLKLNALT
jgi:hypothetical protein